MEYSIPLSLWCVESKKLSPIFNRISFCNLPNHSAGISGGKGIRRDISGYYTSCADHAAFSDGNTSCNNYITGNPTVGTYCDRFSIFVIIAGSVFFNFILRSCQRNGCIGVAIVQLGPKNTLSPIVTGQVSSTVKLKFA